MLFKLIATNEEIVENTPEQQLSELYEKAETLLKEEKFSEALAIHEQMMQLFKESGIDNQSYEGLLHALEATAHYNLKYQVGAGEESEAHFDTAMSSFILSTKLASPAVNITKKDVLDRFPDLAKPFSEEMYQRVSQRTNVQINPAWKSSYKALNEHGERKTYFDCLFSVDAKGVVSLSPRFDRLLVFCMAAKLIGDNPKKATLEFTQSKLVDFGSWVSEMERAFFVLNRSLMNVVKLKYNEILENRDYYVSDINRLGRELVDYHRELQTQIRRYNGFIEAYNRLFKGPPVDSSKMTTETNDLGAAIHFMLGNDEEALSIIDAMSSKITQKHLLSLESMIIKASIHIRNLKFHDAEQVLKEMSPSVNWMQVLENPNDSRNISAYVQKTDITDDLEIVGESFVLKDATISALKRRGYDEILKNIPQPSKHQDARMILELTVNKENHVRLLMVMSTLLAQKGSFAKADEFLSKATLILDEQRLAKGDSFHEMQETHFEAPLLKARIALKQGNISQARESLNNSVYYFLLSHAMEPNGIHSFEHAFRYDILPNIGELRTQNVRFVPEFMILDAIITRSELRQNIVDSRRLQYSRIEEVRRSFSGIREEIAELDHMDKGVVQEALGIDEKIKKIVQKQGIDFAFPESKLSSRDLTVVLKYKRSREDYINRIVADIVPQEMHRKVKELRTTISDLETSFVDLSSDIEQLMKPFGGMSGIIEGELAWLMHHPLYANVELFLNNAINADKKNRGEVYNQLRLQMVFLRDHIHEESTHNLEHWITMLDSGLYQLEQVENKSKEEMLADIRLTIATMIEELLHRVLGRKNDTIKLAHVIDGQQGMFPDAKMTDRTVRGIAHYIERTFNGSGQRKMKDYYDWLISIYQDVKDPVTPKS